MALDFINVKPGDTIYRIKIDNSMLPSKDIINELNVMEIVLELHSLIIL